MKVLLIGANGFGRLHLDTLSRMDIDIEVFARNIAALKEVSQDYDIGKIYSNITEALKSDADVVDIVLPHNMHSVISTKAMNRKKHVLVEKPIAMDVLEGERMIKESVKQGVKFMVAEQYYFDTSASWARETVRSGKIGKLLSIIVRDQRFFTGGGWRVKKEEMGGGALIDGGIHFVDTLLNFGGEYRDVKAYTSKGLSSIEESDTAMSLFAFRNGALGFLYYCWSYPHSPRVPGFEIVGSDGTIIEDVTTKPKADFRFMGGKRHAFGLPTLNGKKVELEIQDVFDAEIGQFLKSVREDTPVPMDPALCLRDLKAVKDIYTSAEL